MYSQSRQFTKEISELKQKLQVAEYASSAAQHEVETLKKKVETAKADSGRVAEAMRVLQLEQTDAQRQTREATALAAAMKEKEEALVRREAAAKKTTEALEKKISAATSLKATMQTKLDAAIAKATSSETSLEQLKKEHARLEKEHATLTKRAAKLESAAANPIHVAPKPSSEASNSVEKTNMLLKQQTDKLRSVEEALEKEKQTRVYSVLGNVLLALVILAIAIKFVQ